MKLNAAARIQADNLHEMMAGYERIAKIGVVKDVQDMDGVANNIADNDHGAFRFQRTVKNLIELAPVLTELASTFRVFGFKPQGPTHFKDGNWVADVKLNNLTVTVDFKTAR